MFAASGITEKTESHYFYKLLKLWEKKVRYEHHHDFLQSCQRNNVILNGLQICKTILVVCKDYESAFDAVTLIQIP